MEYGPPAYGVEIFNIHFPSFPVIADELSPHEEEITICLPGKSFPQKFTFVFC